MTTCTCGFRRHARRVLVGVSATAITLGWVAPIASADQVSNLKSQAAALAARIQTLGNQEDALAEQYDEAQMQLQSLQAKVTQATEQVAQSQQNEARTKSALVQEAIEAYVNGGTNPLESQTISQANNAMVGSAYVATLAAGQNDAVDQYHLAALQYRSAEANLTQQANSARAQVQQVQQTRDSVASLASQLESTLRQDTGQIASLVAQQQAAAAAAAAAAAQAAEAAAQQAANQQIVAQATPSFNGLPPAPTAAAAGAVRAALSRVGDPYVWGGSGPNDFDCSGLVMWAYEQVGIDLPHFSGAQYADTTHISMSDLEPGDLVFPADPGQHVAMYIGNGDIVQAPYTGADVQVVGLSSFFVLASRVT